MGGMGVLKGAIEEEVATGTTGAGIGFIGILMMVVPIAWWIWGMIDAKNLCEAFNNNIRE